MSAPVIPAIALLGLFAVSCSGAGPKAPPAPPQSLTVLQLNIWQEATSVKGGFQSLVAELLGSKADVIALSEIRNYQGVDFITKLVSALNASGQATFYGRYAGGDSGIVSRFPLIDVTPVALGAAGNIVKARLDVGGQEVVAYSAHLDYTHYACYLPRGYHDDSEQYPGWSLIGDGHGNPAPVTDPAILARSNQASTRQAAIQAFLQDARTIAPKTPVFLMGDFNEPSALDWVDATRNLFDHHGVTYAWDTSVLLTKGGFQDAYRVVHPSPLTHPGFTWPAPAGAKMMTSWAVLADERDRIDFVYYRGVGVQPIQASLWGPSSTCVRGEIVPEQSQDTFAQSTDNWPSDHKGVLVLFSLR